MCRSDHEVVARQSQRGGFLLPAGSPSSHRLANAASSNHAGAIPVCVHRYLGANQLTGTVPTSLCSLTFLYGLCASQPAHHDALDICRSKRRWSGRAANSTACGLRFNGFAAFVSPCSCLCLCGRHDYAPSTHRDLSANQLTGTVPASLGSLKYLQSLCASLAPPA